MIEKLKKYYHEPLVNFGVKGVMVYVLWKFTLKASQVLHPFVEWWNYLTGLILKFVIFISYLLLKFLGNDVIQEGAFITVKGYSGVVVGPACVGIGIIFGFTGLILAYPGSKKLRAKFIIGGFFALNFINAIRVTILCLLTGKYYDWAEFNHKYIFNNLLYVVVFLLWVWYVNSSNKAPKQNIKNNDVS